MKIKKSLFILTLAFTLLVGAVIGASGADMQETISAILRRDLNIEVNGEKQILKDANGDVIYPITYNGSTYVPFRAIGNLLDGVEVGWDQDTQTASYTTTGNSAGPDKPEAKGVDLIDDIEPGFDGSSQAHLAFVRSGQGQKVKVAGKVLDHWLRASLWGEMFKQIPPCYSWYNLSGEFDTLTMTAYSNYDVTVTVYENRTKDRILGTFPVTANAEPTTQTIQIDGAVQIYLDIIADEHSTGDHYVYIYDAYLN